MEFDQQLAISFLVFLQCRHLCGDPREQYLKFIYFLLFTNHSVFKFWALSDTEVSFISFILCFICFFNIKYHIFVSFSVILLSHVEVNQIMW